MPASSRHFYIDKKSPPRRIKLQCKLLKIDDPLILTPKTSAFFINQQSSLHYLLAES